MGGTWWKNSYPGAAVDVPSHLYSFSFEPYNWSRLFAKQAEILNYTESVIHKHKIASKTKTNVAIKSLQYDEALALWTINFVNEAPIQATFVISGTGSLSQANLPNLKGLNSFEGKYFHSSNWDHEYDYSNKSIAVIGTGASAVQLVPELAKKAKNLYVLQRTAHWLLPRPDRELKSWELKLLKIPMINKMFRALTYFKNESRAIFFTKIPSLAKLVKLEALHHLKQQVKDDALRAQLTPNFDIGCKRILLSNDYYPCLEKEYVKLISSGISAITPKGISLDNQEHLDLDLIVFATGFHAAEKAIPFDIIGKENLSIHDYWKDGAKAYYGTMVAHFPMLFFLMGPNTGTGHTSVIYFIESQMNYIMDALKKAKANNWKAIEIKEEVQDQFNTKIQRQLKNSIWHRGACDSWYINSAGLNTTMFPNFSFVFRHHTKSFKKDLHHIRE